jgi:UDP-N-acetylmuramate dehydrogenase
MSQIDDLEARGRLKRDVPLGRHTTYKMGGPARYLVDADSEADVVLAASLARDEGLALLSLGRGSNMVVAESGFDGIVVRTGPGLSTFAIDGERVIAGAGCALPRLARETAAAGLGGLEFFTGIPGSVGGAVRMNAGCHGVETADRLVSARIVDANRGDVSERRVEELGLAYRTSNLADTDIVVSAEFRAIPTDPAIALGQIREITRWRRLNQPGGTLNAGSVFKNPEGDAAGRIIDSLGLKGLAVGAVRVSERHANFFVAEAGATPGDVHALVAEVRRRVREATGIDLEPEIRFVGEFE